MTFEEKTTDEWYNNSQSTAQDLIKSAIDEGYTREEAEERLKGTKWAKKNSDAYKKAWKQYDALTSSEQDDLKARSSDRKTRKVTEAVTKTSPLIKKADLVAKGKDAQLPLFPEEKEEKKVSLTKEDAAKIKDTAKSLKPTSEKYQKLVENARKSKGPKSPLEVAEEVKDILEEGREKKEEPGSKYKWMLTDEAYNAKNKDGTDSVTAAALVAQGKADGMTAEEIAESLKGTKWEKSAKVKEEIKTQYPPEEKKEEPEEGAGIETVTTSETDEVQEEPEHVKEMEKITSENVDLSDGLSETEAETIAKAYDNSTDNVRADMFLNYMRSVLNIPEDAIKKIVDNTKQDSRLKKEYYKGKPILENVGGTTGTEMRNQKKASDALENDVIPGAYEEMKEGSDEAGEDVASSKTYEIERNPKSILSALINGEFGRIDKDADPKERQAAINTALYLGGDVVATALRNVGATFKNQQAGNESLWTQRQKSKFEAATANANKTLDAGTETAIKGKQNALDMKQNLQKSIKDGRVQLMIDSLKEDIKADDVLRDMDKYSQAAAKFKAMSLDEKANYILGMEIDGKDFSKPALIAMLASLSPSEFADLGAKVGDLAKALGTGLHEALQGIFGKFLPKEPPTAQDVTDAIRDTYGTLFEATGIADKMKEADLKKLAKAAENARQKNEGIQPQVDALNAVADVQLPGVKVKAAGGKIILDNNITPATYKKYAQAYGLPWTASEGSHIIGELKAVKERIAVELLKAYANTLPE